MSDRDKSQRIYRVSFLSQGEVYEVYARHVGQGGLFGFVEIEGLVFGERSQVVVDPSEERLKTEFKDVRRVYVPMHAVLRIDEVDKEGVSRITRPSADGGEIRAFPGPIYTPQDTRKK